MASWLQPVKITGVPADGTPHPITYPTPFLVNIASVTFGISNYSGSDNPMIGVPLIQGDPALDGFTVTVSGGQPESTVTLECGVLGS